MLLGGQFNRRGNWKRYTVTLVAVGVLLAAVVAVSNIAVKHPHLVVVMYALPLGTCILSLYAIIRRPLEKAVPTDPPAHALRQEGN